MTSSTRKLIITILVLPNIPRRKGYQTVKFDQLIEYNVKIFFLKNHTQNMLEKLVPEPFLKNQN